MGRGSRKKEDLHWTDQHPDRKHWTPHQRALAGMMTQEAYEGLYGRGGSSGGLVADAPMAELEKLAREDSVSFLHLYRAYLRPETTSGDITRDPLLEVFINSVQEQQPWGALPNDKQWREHFKSECVRAILEEEFAKSFSLESSLWRWNQSAAARFFESRSQGFLDEIESLENNPSTENESALEELAQKAHMWISFHVLPAVEDDPARESVLLRTHPGQPLPLLAARSIDLRKSEGRPAFSQKVRQDWIVSSAYKEDHPFRQEWDRGSERSTLPRITGDYRTREVDRIVENEAELTMATLYAVMRGSAELETLWSLRESVQRDLGKRLGDRPEENLRLLLQPLQAIFEKEGRPDDFLQIDGIAANFPPELLVEKTAKALYHASVMFNAAAGALQDGPGIDLADCLLAGFQEAAK